MNVNSNHPFNGFPNFNGIDQSIVLYSDPIINNMKKENKNTLWDNNIYNSNIGLFRKTRWGNKTFQAVPMSKFPKNLTINEKEILIRRVRINDLSKRINNNDWENNDPDLRSPSPEPIYDKKSGKKMNTFDVRMKEKAKLEKDKLIEELISMDKTFKPPLGWKPPMKQLKIYYNNRPDVNITSMIIGPNGVTINELSKKTGCHIYLRGGENNKTSFEKNFDDNTHILVEARTDDLLLNAKKLIEPLIDLKTSEHYIFRNRHRNLVNKTFGVVVNQRDLGCESCGQTGHTTWACPISIKANLLNIVCSICGGKAHLSIDCLKSSEKQNIIKKEDEFENFIQKINNQNNSKLNDINDSILIKGMNTNEIKINRNKDNSNLNLKEN